MSLPPRFLLPLRTARSAHAYRQLSLRQASTRSSGSSRPPPKAAPSPSKASIPPNTLAKPDRYRPPSHPAHIPKAQTPVNHGGELSAEEIARQSKKRYPNMMPPPGSFSHWFLTTRSLHLFITVGILTGVTVWTISGRFERGYPHLYDLLPTKQDWVLHPFSSISRFLEVVRLHAYERTEEARRGRKLRVDDSFKRSAYNKAHGIQDNPFLDSIGLKKEEGQRKEVTLADQKWGRGTEERGVQFEVEKAAAEASLAGAAAAASTASAEQEGSSETPPKSSKKWFGLW